MTKENVSFDVPTVTQSRRGAKRMESNMIRKTIDRILFRHGAKNNSPKWAFMEGFRVPDIEDPTKDYLWRLRLIQTPWFGIYLHKLCGPDARSELHDHPWSFISFVLRGGYTEFVPGPYYAQSRYVKRVNVKRFNKSYHWIAELDRTPTWTLVFVGRRRRVWGYLDRDGIRTDFDKHEFNDSYLKALATRGGGEGMM